MDDTEDAGPLGQGKRFRRPCVELAGKGSEARREMALAPVLRLIGEDRGAEGEGVVKAFHVMSWGTDGLPPRRRG